MAWRRGQPYGQDLRDRVSALADDGYGVVEIGESLRVGTPYVSKVLNRREKSGELTARPQQCHVPRKLDGLDDALRGEIKAKPDMTLSDLRGWLLKTHAVKASLRLLSETLTKLDLTRKKRPCMRKSKPVPMSRQPARNGARRNLI